MSENKEQLDSFLAYCIDHPHERFWQALRNWSSYNFIYGSQELIDIDGLIDTFYK